MFYIVVRLTDKTGQYPVNYLQSIGQYRVSEKRFHDQDNPGGPLTVETLPRVISEVANLPNIKEIRAVRYD